MTLGIPIFRRSAAGLDVPGHSRFETDDRTPATWPGSNLYVHPMLADPNDAAANPFEIGDNASKAMRVNVVAGGGAGGGTSSAFGAPFPASGTAAGAKDTGGNMAALNLDATGRLLVATPAGGAGLTDAELRASAVPVSVASLPLPLGAATEATLAAMSAKFPAALVGGRFDINNGAWLGSTAPTVGQKTMANSIPVVIASDQTAIAITAAALPLPAGAATEATLATRLAEATFTARINTQGQKAMAASTPVVLASDQAAIPVTVASLPLPAGAATEATLATRLADATFTGRFPAATALADAFANPTVTHIGVEPMLWNGTTWDRARGTIANGMAVDVTRVQGNVAITAAALPLPAGAATEATLSAMSAKLPAALVGGRLDVNVGAWMGSTAPTVGQKAMASSLPVVISSDQTAVAVKGSDSDNAANSTTKLPVIAARANAAVPAWTEGNEVPMSVDLTGRERIYGGLDHDAANDLTVLQVGGNARAVDDPPAAVSAIGDRVRVWNDRFGAYVVRRRKIRESYTAVFRLAEAAARLDQTFTHVANTNKQWATIHHTAAATKELRLQRCWLYITSDTVAGIQGIAELRELSVTTPPATGNPVITPRVHRIGSGVAEATCLYLPTTQGSEAAVNGPLGHVPFDTGISGAVSTLNPVPILIPVVLWDANADDDEVMNATAPVGVYGGWAVMIRTVGVPVLRCTVFMRFTEEIP